MFCTHRDGDSWVVRYLEAGMAKRRAANASDMHLTGNVKIVTCESVGLAGGGLAFLSDEYALNPIRSLKDYRPIDYSANEIDPDLETPKQILLKGGKRPKAYWHGRSKAHKIVEDLIDQANLRYL